MINKQTNNIKQSGEPTHHKDQMQRLKYRKAHGYKSTENYRNKSSKRPLLGDVNAPHLIYIPFYLREPL